MNKLKSTAKINALFLTIVLIAGTITLMFPSSITASAQTEPYYGIDKDRKSHGKDVNVKSIKCNNININVNGLELNNTTSVPFLNNLLASKGHDGDGGASSYGSGSYGYGGQSGSDNNSFKFVCVNNNNNTVVTVNEPPSEEPTATLKVIKQVACTEEQLSNSISIQQALGPCDLLENLITENQYLFEITNDNPVPSQFPGSESGTIVTLSPGNYIVTETPNTTSINQDITTLLMQFPGVDSVGIDPPVFTGDCTELFPGNRATGTIEAGESQTCNIVNNFVIHVTDPCEGCFSANNALQAVIEDQLVKQTVDFGFVVGSDNIIIPSGVDTIEQLCPLLEGHTDVLIDNVISTIVLIQTGSTTAFQAEIDALIECLLEAGVIVEATAGLVAPFDINTAGGLASSLSSQPTIAKGTEDLSALEKTTKLKKQWLELLP